MDSNKADVQLKKLLKWSKVPTVKKQEEVSLDQPAQSCIQSWCQFSPKCSRIVVAIALKNCD